MDMTFDKRDALIIELLTSLDRARGLTNDESLVLERFIRNEQRALARRTHRWKPAEDRKILATVGRKGHLKRVAADLHVTYSSAQTRLRQLKRQRAEKALERDRGCRE